MADNTFQSSRRSSRAKRNTSRMREAVETGELRASRPNSNTKPIPATVPKTYERKAGPPNAPELLRAPTPSVFNGTPPPTPPPSGPSSQETTPLELTPPASKKATKPAGAPTHRRASRTTGPRRGRKPSGPKLCGICSHPVYHPQPKYSLTAVNQTWKAINIAGAPNRSDNEWPPDMLPRAKVIYNDAVLRAELCWKGDCDCMREQRLSSVKQWAEQVDMLSEQVEGIKGMEERVNEYWSKIQAMDMPRLQEWVDGINNDRGMHEEDAVYRNDVVMEHNRGTVALCERVIERIVLSEEDNETGLLPATEKMKMALAQLQGDTEVLLDRQKTVIPKRPAMNEGECMGDLKAMGIPMPATKIRKIFRC